MANSVFDKDPYREPADTGSIYETSYGGGTGGGFFGSPGPGPVFNSYGYGGGSSYALPSQSGYAPNQIRRRRAGATYSGGTSSPGVYNTPQVPESYATTGGETAPAPQRSGRAFGRRHEGSNKQQAPDPYAAENEAYEAARVGDPSGAYWQLLMDRLSGGKAGFSHGQPYDYWALMDMILGGAGQGAFGPSGDPRVQEMYDAGANRRGLDLERSAVLGADLDGGDFWNRGLAATLARDRAGQARNDFYNQSRLNAADNYSDLMRWVLGQKYGEYKGQWERDAYLADKDHDEKRQGGFGRFIGDTAGRVASKWLP